MLSDTVVALFLDLIAMLMLVFGKKKESKIRALKGTIHTASQYYLWLRSLSKNTLTPKQKSSYFPCLLSLWSPIDLKMLIVLYTISIQYEACLFF